MIDATLEQKYASIQEAFRKQSDNHQELLEAIFPVKDMSDVPDPISFVTKLHQKNTLMKDFLNKLRVADQDWLEIYSQYQAEEIIRKLKKIDLE